MAAGEDQAEDVVLRGDVVEPVAVRLTDVRRLLRVDGARWTAVREAFATLAPFGRIVVVGMPGGHPFTLDGRTIRTAFYDPALNQSLHAFNLGLFFGLRPQAAVSALTTLVGHVASGQVKVPIANVLPLEAAAQAHRLLETRAATGKLVLAPWE